MYYNNKKLWKDDLHTLIRWTTLENYPICVCSWVFLPRFVFQNAFKIVQPIYGEIWKIRWNDRFDAIRMQTRILIHEK